MRRSPVSGHGSSKSVKAKTPKSKASRTAGTGRPLSNGVHEVYSNGVATKKTEDEGEQEIAKMNFLTLQKVDSSVSRILATVPHVVLYEFKTAENMWVSSDIGLTLVQIVIKQPI